MNELVFTVNILADDINLERNSPVRITEQFFLAKTKTANTHLGLQSYRDKAGFLQM